MTSQIYFKSKIITVLIYEYVYFIDFICYLIDKKCNIV